MVRESRNLNDYDGDDNGDDDLLNNIRILKIHYNPHSERS